MLTKLNVCLLFASLAANWLPTNKRGINLVGEPAGSELFGGLRVFEGQIRGVTFHLVSIMLTASCSWGCCGTLQVHRVSDSFCPPGSTDQV